MILDMVRVFLVVVLVDLEVVRVVKVHNVETQRGNDGFHSKGYGAWLFFSEQTVS